MESWLATFHAFRCRLLRVSVVNRVYHHTSFVRQRESIALNGTLLEEQVLTVHMSV